MPVAGILSQHSFSLINVNQSSQNSFINLLTQIEFVYFGGEWTTFEQQCLVIAQRYQLW